MMKKLLTLLLFSGIMSGCTAIDSIMGGGAPTQTDRAIEAVVDAGETLTVLSAVGGLCLLAGMVLLCLSKGTMGWRPVIGGIVLIVLNYMIASYADWIFIPVIIATGCISSAWGFKIFVSIINKEYKHGNHCK
jgi:hypothetical protein